MASPRKLANPMTSVTVVKKIDEDCAGSCPSAVSRSGIAAPATAAIVIERVIAMATTSASPGDPLQKSTPAPATVKPPVDEAKTPDVADPAPVALKSETVTADTPKATVAGNPFTLPKDWSIAVKGPATILSLPETYREVLVLRDIEEMSTDETAKSLGITPNAVKIRLHRARLALSLELCADPLLEALFEDETPFEELPQAMPRLLAPDGGGLCHRIRYG